MAGGIKWYGISTDSLIGVKALDVGVEITAL